MLKIANAEIVELNSIRKERYQNIAAHIAKGVSLENAEKIMHSKNNFKGENNPNWKGGISKDHYHYKKIQKERYPESKCRDILYKAKSKGEITPPKFCEKCGNKLKLHAHHKDYSKPLDVTWLCRYCHRELHGRTTKKES